MLKFFETACSLEEVPASKTDQVAGKKRYFFFFFPLLSFFLFTLKSLFWKENFLKKEDPSSQAGSALVSEFSTSMQLGIPAPNLLLHLQRGWLSFFFYFLAHVEEEVVVLAVPILSGEKGNKAEVSWDQSRVFHLFRECLDTNGGRWAGRGALCLTLCAGQKGRWRRWVHREKGPGWVAAFPLRGKKKQSLLSALPKSAHPPSQPVEYSMNSARSSLRAFFPAP